MNSFDTLASHLYTTFIALSTALALRGSPEKVTEALCHHQKHGVARAFFAVALGPTVGTAKSRVIVGIDGLETKVWGLREDTIPDNVSEEDENDNSLEDASDTDDEEEESEEEEENASGSDDDAPPPPSRSPSPAPLTASPSISPRNMPSKSPLLRTEDPETVRAAERLLSRTLAGACAEDDGHGLASEMGKPYPYSCWRVAHSLLAPTQIHVLLRAPRRFDHPSWMPRQNLCSSLDSHLADFLVESGEAPDTTTKKRTKASKVEGVWIKSRGSSTIKSSEEDLAEEDELTWWSWEEKLVGFSDW